MLISEQHYEKKPEMYKTEKPQVKTIAICVTRVQSVALPLEIVIVLAKLSVSDF